MTKQDIERMAIAYRNGFNPKKITTPMYDMYDIEEAFCQGGEQVLDSLWKDAQGDYLPEYDREVIALVNYDGHWRIQFAHRPNPKGYVVVEGEKLYAKTYGKGWNWPDIDLWLDVELPEEIED